MVRKEREKRKYLRRVLSHTLSRKNLLASFLAHAFYALLITIQNSRSNGKRYEYDRPERQQLMVFSQDGIVRHYHSKIAEKYGNLFRTYEKITSISAYAEPMAWWKLGALTEVINLLIRIIVGGLWWKVIGIW